MRHMLNGHCVNAVTSQKVAGGGLAKHTGADFKVVQCPVRAPPLFDWTLSVVSFSIADCVPCVERLISSALVESYGVNGSVLTPLTISHDFSDFMGVCTSTPITERVRLRFSSRAGVVEPPRSFSILVLLNVSALEVGKSLESKHI